MKSATAIRESGSDRLFMFAVYGFLSLFGLLIFYPLYFILISSFSSAEAVIRGDVWLWPVDPTLIAYESVLKYPLIWSSFRNSIFYAAAGTLVSVSLTVMMGYPLSRQTFVGRGLLIWLILFAMMFSGGLIPFYILVKSLGMLNSPWAMIIPGALSSYSVIIAKTFFQSTISNELYNAAEIDGCSDIRFITSIVLPLSKPIIAVLALWAAVGSWNSYFGALIFLSEKNLFPLQLILREILVLNSISNSSFNMSPELLRRMEEIRTLLKYALIVVTSVPILLLFPFIQKHFIKGVMIGSLKE